ncbi:RICIN domain-containing protein [Saccharothrix coeruleofusca]|uniref:Ricin-type beta-trefoil lectin protein n=1 Tax=Saccharothrix coeruleofusca TaxID=33919 RepID=A0A918EET6_9PSEU|nr:hypothetical protein [Saccharothrix coeruleofusca]GGP68783.1 hypothetical protein GCM10010185_47160 [Saccharothrix coeruleofusca]
MSYEHENALFVNRLNGGTLFVVNGVADGADVGCVRYSTWDKNRRHRWTVRKVAEENGRDVMTIEVADGGKVFCVDAGDAKISQGIPVKIRERDGSDRQKWYFAPDPITDGKLINIWSYSNWSAALTLHTVDPEWDRVVLDRSFFSDSQLWYQDGSHYHDEIPD